MPKSKQPSSTNRSSLEQNIRSEKKHIKSVGKNVKTSTTSRTRRKGKKVGESELKRRGPEPEFNLKEYLDRHLAIPGLSYADLFGRVYVGWCYNYALHKLGMKVTDIGKILGSRKFVYSLRGIGKSTEVQPLTFAAAFQWADEVVKIEFSKLVVTVQNLLDDELAARGLTPPRQPSR